MKINALLLAILAIVLIAFHVEVSAQRWCRGTSDRRCLVKPCPPGKKIVRWISQDNDKPFPSCCADRVCG